MSKKNKGFTLIELLAVIVILAVIALIATPIVLNVIDSAKEKSLVNSAYGVVDAAKLEYIQSQFEGTTVKTGDATKLVVSGEKPTAGTWKVVTEASAGEDVGIYITGVKFASMNDYTCASVTNGDNQGKIECKKD